MSYERDDYMRRQDAEHEMIRMREPSRAACREMDEAGYVSAFYQVGALLDIGARPKALKPSSRR